MSKAHQISLRKACTDEIPLIAKIHLQLWKESYQGLMDQSFLDSLESTRFETGWANNLEKKEQYRRILIHEDKIIGFLWCRSCS